MAIAERQDKANPHRSLLIGGRYVNPFDTWRDKTLWDFVRWLLTRTAGNGLPVDRSQLERDLPLATPHYPLLRHLAGQQRKDGMDGSKEMDGRDCSEGIDFSEEVDGRDCAEGIDFSEEVDGLEDYLDYPAIANIDRDAAVTATWIGQSTCFVQMEGLNVLTDPIFKRRTVFSWLGPERLRPAPCRLSDLPRPDIVLVSHNHFDHLDVDVVKALGNSVTWYVPLGLRRWFARQGIHRVKEMDWWQEAEHIAADGRRFQIVSTPTQHWSGRTGLDSNASLWSSFLVRGSHASVFHCGDTGYCPAFERIGQLYGPVSLAILPIGSYEPRWYMCHQHINPDDAVRIHRDLGARKSIGVHWGTFMMSDEHYLAPPRELAAAAAKHGLTEDEFVAPQIGRTNLYTF
ncbi:hypothetical protein GGI23_002930 [Coemansia sp. RSA 2559]|nr:hypothetical protein GGI23_002930 [Coemansia sp. RSA 2559]